MDGNAKKILKKILEESPSGEAVVLENAELTALLSHAEQPETELKQILGELNGAELIRLKYADRTSCCVASLPKGRLVGTEKNEVAELNRSVMAPTVRRRWKQALIPFVASFFGAFLGGAAAIGIFLGLFA